MENLEIKVWRIFFN